MKRKTKEVCFDPSDPFYPSDREMERLLAYEFSYANTGRVTRQEPFRGRPDPSSVLLQEAVGTREMVTSDQLPAEMNQDELRRIGVEIVGPSKGDKMFIDVKLPPGWKKVPCREDSRTTHLIDDKGNRRAYMWYKAASCDRKAYGGVNVRYGIDHRTFNDWGIGVAWVVDKKDPSNPRPIFQTQDHVYPNKDGYKDETRAALYDECRAWLDANLPDWKDVAAYWDAQDMPTIGSIPPWSQRTR